MQGADRERQRMLQKEVLTSGRTATIFRRFRLKPLLISCWWRWSRPRLWEADGNPDPAVVNLYASVGDFILHFCAQNYLCAEGESYFTTDLAKGAMPTGQARKTAAKRWPKWHELLKEELELVGKQDAKVIAVGRGLETFLKNSGTPKPSGWILHWYPNARVARAIAPQLFPQEYEKFSEGVSAEGLASYVEELIRDKVFDKSRDRILRDIRKSGGTESNKMLMFTYKCQFAAILGKPIT